VYGSGVVHFPNLQKALEDLGRNLGAWTYLLVAVSAFLETGAFVGLLAPGETVMLVGGLVAGQGEIDVLRLIGLAWTAAVAGDVTSFMLGRRLGGSSSCATARRSPSPRSGLEKVEGFFARHGGKAILLGRFVGLVRAIAPFLAGSSGSSSGASCPTTSSARACGPRRSSCWATSSGPASTASSTTPSRARWRWGP
jgi:undecaprenyl-diphosphatase